MRKTWFCWVPILMIFLCNTETSSFASPTKKGSSIPLQLKPGVPLFSQKNQNVRITSLQPRASDSVHELPNGWIGRIQKHLLFLPVQAAASILTNFYNRVAHQITAQWIDQPPVNHFIIGWENVQLEFYSVTRTIPWNFILAFAQKMIAETQRGFTGKYDVREFLPKIWYLV